MIGGTTLMTMKQVEAGGSPPFLADGVTAGSVVYPPGGHYGPRMQQNFQLVLLHTGRAMIRVDGVVNHLPPGHVALLHPGHTEEFFFANDTETWHRWVDVHPMELSNWNDYLTALPFALPLSNAMNQLTDLLYDLSHQTTVHASHESLLSLGLGAIWLYVSESEHRGQERAKHPAVSLVKTAIHEGFPQALTLTGLAAVASVSPEHLIRLFRQCEGITPMKYLWQVRVNRALELLQSTGLTLREIAEQTGFQTTYHLSRLVKTKTGFTATEIRHQGWHGHVVKSPPDSRKTSGAAF